MKVFLINMLLFSGIYYTLYLLLFRRSNFFKLNRFVLLLIPLLSIAIPAIAPFFNDPILESTGFATTLLPLTINADLEMTSQNSSTLPFGVWTIVYGFGAVVSLSLFLFGLFKAHKIWSHGKSATWENIQFRFSRNTPASFAFFNRIVVPESLEHHPNLYTILRHEQVHCRQAHSADVVYYNLLTVIFWFNPFFHLLMKELRQTHECLADEKTIEKTSREVYARMLLSSTFGQDSPFPVTTGSVHPFFNSSLLKTRITMLYKKQSPRWLKTAYWIMLPLALLMTLHACNKASEGKDESTEMPVEAVSFAEVEQPPLFEDCDVSAGMDEQKVCFQRGLIKHLQEHMKYPDKAKELGLEGTVYVQFVIDQNGKIQNAEVMRGIVPDDSASAEMQEARKELDDRAIMIISKLPQMSPAKMKGKNTAIKFTLPISFRLQ